MEKLNFGSVFLQADTIGSAAIAALCQALAAEVHGRRGESEAAANALQQATDAADGADCPAAASLWHAASFSFLLTCSVMVCTYLLQEQSSTTCMPCCVRARFIRVCHNQGKTVRAGLESSCDLAAAAIRARLALADACCRRWRGDAAGALARCGAGLAALEACSSGGDGGSGGDACCGGGAARFAPWAAADVALRLRLQQAKCHHLLVSFPGDANNSTAYVFPDRCCSAAFICPDQCHSAACICPTQWSHQTLASHDHQCDDEHLILIGRMESFLLQSRITC